MKIVGPRMVQPSSTSEKASWTDSDNADFQESLYDLDTAIEMHIYVPIWCKRGRVLLSKYYKPRHYTERIGALFTPKEREKLEEIADEKKH